VQQSLTEISNLPCPAMRKASWRSWHKQFRDTPAALRSGFCIPNAIWFCWSEI